MGEPQKTLTESESLGEKGRVGLRGQKSPKQGQILIVCQTGMTGTQELEGTLGIR